MSEWMGPGILLVLFLLATVFKSVTENHDEDGRRQE